MQNTEKDNNTVQKKDKKTERNRKKYKKNIIFDK